MPINSYTSNLRFAVLFAGVIFLFASSSFAGNARKQINRDGVFYAQVFHLIGAFDRDGGSLINYFGEQTEISEGQLQILKTIAGSFETVSGRQSKTRQLSLALYYRDELKKLFGKDEFVKFERILREKVVFGIISPADGCPPGQYPSCNSSISIVGSVLTGCASTVQFSFGPTVPEANCTTSATMSGPGVSVSDTDTAGCFERNTSVTLMSTVYQPNSQYCINATHVGLNGGGSTSACLTTPNPPRVTSVDYELITPGLTGIDNNPKAGRGMRIFTDDDIPDDPVDRRKVRVKAQYYQPTAGVRIYFRNFDVDDPSADVAPIDINDTTTLMVGNDNNGNVDGTVATRGGVLVVPAAGQPNPYDCQPFSNTNASGVSCITDVNGLTKVDFTVTMQPGDNFAVVAGPDETYVSSLVPANDGINLKDANNVQTPVAVAASNGCTNASLKACRADMLTVWRRVHIEYDSMGDSNGHISGNSIIGTIPSNFKVRSGVITLNLNVNPSLDINQF